MSVVKLRIEIERALHDYAAANCFAATRPAGIGAMLQDLQRRGLAPPSTENFLDALRVMNAASHGGRSDAEGAERAVRLGTAFLAELTGAIACFSYLVSSLSCNAAYLLVAGTGAGSSWSRAVSGMPKKKAASATRAAIPKVPKAAE